MVDVTLNVYQLVAKEQAVFLHSWQPADLMPFPQSRLSQFEGLDYSSSTYSRLLKERTVAVVLCGTTKVIPVRLLMPTSDQAKAYGHIDAINRAFQAELCQRRALSDCEMEAFLGGRVARRTITKYRCESGVPEAAIRNRHYETEAAEPFRATTKLSKFLALSGNG